MKKDLIFSFIAIINIQTFILLSGFQNIFTIATQNDTDTIGNYRPPYTDEDSDADSAQEQHFGVKLQTCNGLVLSSAINLGPYQAGVIKQLVSYFKLIGDVQYQVVSGLSVGALNAHIFSQFPVGQEDKAASKIEQFWYEIAERNADLIQSWSWGMIYGFFYENSIYNANGLYDFIMEKFQNTTLQRHLNIGLANVLNGQFKSFKEFHTSDEFVKILQASIAFPGVFKTVEAYEQLWFTGSAIQENDVIAPIKHCREIGYSDEKISIDVILNGSPQINHVMSSIYNSFGILERTFEVQNYYERMFGILRAKQAHPEVNFRHIIGPMRSMPNKIIPLEFTKKEVESQINLGVQDALNYITQYKENQINQLRVQSSIQNLQDEQQSNQSEIKKVQPHCQIKKRYHSEMRQAKYLESCK